VGEKALNIEIKAPVSYLTAMGSTSRLRVINDPTTMLLSFHVASASEYYSPHIEFVE